MKKRGVVGEIKREREKVQTHLITTTTLELKYRRVEFCQIGVAGVPSPRPIRSKDTENRTAVYLEKGKDGVVNQKKKT